MWIFWLLLLAPLAEVSASGPASDSEISATLTVPHDLFVPYDDAALLNADLALEAAGSTPPTASACTCPKAPAAWPS